jgi:hypothetical protein
MNLAMADKRPLFADITGLKKAASVVVLVALADWLFYGRPLGISLLVFLLALDIGALVANPVRGKPRDIVAAFGVLVVFVLPLIVETSLIAFGFAAIGAAYFALAATRCGADWSKRIADAAALPLDGTWQATADITRCVSAWSKGAGLGLKVDAMTVWIVPAVLGAIFLLLFANANPLIEGWFAAIDLRALLAHLSIARIVFWLMMLSLSWPFVFMAAKSRLKAKAEAKAEALLNTQLDIPESALPERLFGKAAILRSLVLFNLLFAVQTMLDGAYLWGGVALPNGMSYASYAHRGAYPLIVTALLAAAFVIAAMRPGTEAERSPVIRGLVYLWVAQNVGLVVSSILRLDLYVAVLSLTYWRVAAFVWMVLVAAGLFLIVLRIILRRSNLWLIKINLASLALTLYVCAFVNFPELIATYNVAHSREMSGKGELLDTGYLLSLGPHAIPALDTYLAPMTPDNSRYSMWDLRDKLAQTHLTPMGDWRAWSYRDWRLAEYLRKAPDGKNQPAM